MPLPLPIMIPFMMWQSAAIAAGFGTYFQYAKRRVSAMSNEEFNASNPHDLVNTMYDELIVAMPSSFKKIESLTPVILDSMLKMLTDAADWFAGILGGGGGLTELQRRLAGGDPLNPLLPGADVGDDGRQTSDFVPDVRGQSSIPSVAWLNSLNREQLKAIRNDALRGDYNKDSTKLILARYKQIFEFDRDASIPDSALGGTPIASLAFTGVPASRVPSGLHSLVQKRLINEKSLTKVYTLLNAQFAQFNTASKNTRSSAAARAAALSIRNQITTLIVWLNNTFIPNR